MPARRSFRRPPSASWATSTSRSRPEGLSRRRDRLAPSARSNPTQRLLRQGRLPPHLRSRSPAGGPITIHNLYVPAGGDEPDPQINEKFAHKLAFHRRDEELARQGAMPRPRGASLVGDLNIAPLEHDVWSHKQLLKVVSHTPVETEGLAAHREQRRAGSTSCAGTCRRTRSSITWWSYRAPDWEAVEPRPQARPHLVTADLGAALDRDRILRRGARLAAAVRPRAGDRRASIRLKPVRSSCRERASSNSCGVSSSRMSAVERSA